eukprot:TRINITY_DN3017_c0_g1_i17.p1 TRINITY_DN3017_c0_g1~~TRINITY_DN3017_c0_g1_i17.p1  ORF type:complete len:116 (-),score=10.76 TRINITY_DN3017_c0_g1_i17:932-1279(-)
MHITFKVCNPRCLYDYLYYCHKKIESYSNRYFLEAMEMLFLKLLWPEKQLREKKRENRNGMQRNDILGTALINILHKDFVRFTRCTDMTTEKKIEAFSNPSLSNTFLISSKIWKG